MTSYVENETKFQFDFSMEKLLETVAEAVLDMEKCPYEIQLNFVLTNHQGIRECNKEFRNIDKETDVLSFPGVEFEIPGEFAFLEDYVMDYFDPESGELMLGDIMINYERVLKQAEEYGHSVKREFAFLVAHSMLHLLGYDHMEEAEAKIMEQKQESVLQMLGITRNE